MSGESSAAAWAMLVLALPLLLLDWLRGHSLWLSGVLVGVGVLAVVLDWWMERDLERLVYGDKPQPLAYWLLGGVIYSIVGAGMGCAWAWRKGCWLWRIRWNWIRHMPFRPLVVVREIYPDRIAVPKTIGNSITWYDSFSGGERAVGVNGPEGKFDGICVFELERWDG